MSTTFKLDHLVIAVTDLQQASVNYARLGFNVVVGGHHQHAPTQNALVYFADGTYLELIEWTAPNPGERWYDHLVTHGDGLVDFAFVPSDIQGAVAQANVHGSAYRGPIPGSRLRPDGKQVRWQLGWPVENYLPFLCGDVTPRSLRVPEGDVRQQPNQVKGIASVSVRVSDVEKAAQAYKALLGAGSGVRFGSLKRIDESGVEFSTLEIGQTRLHLVAPSTPEPLSLGSRLAEALRQRGPGAYRIGFEGSPDLVLPWPDPTLTHGVSLGLGSAV